MERLSDTVIEIVNELHRERLDYDSEYLPLMDAINRLAAYEDTGLEPQTISEILDSVSGWYDAHKEGRLVVLPCKVGDTVWRIKKGICAEKKMCVSGDVCAEMIMSVCPDYSGKPTVERSTFRLCDYNDVGKSIFRTREEAETKLMERGE